MSSRGHFGSFVNQALNIYCILAHPDQCVAGTASPLYICTLYSSSLRHIEDVFLIKDCQTYAAVIKDLKINVI